MEKNSYLCGFKSQTSEVENKQLELSGTLPEWLTGTLYRNGPALFDVGKGSVRHWFDGFGMLHRLNFRDGCVTYNNRFIKSRGYQSAIKEKRIKFHLFATAPDYRWWQRLIAWFKEPAFSYNTNVNIARYGEQFVSMTESSDYNTHDPETLATNEPIDLGHLGQLTTAHPHFDYDTNEFINLCVKLGPKSQYRFFAKDHQGGEPGVFAEYETGLPSYVHSFGLSANYVILILSPLKLNPLRLRFGNKPYYDCYHWDESHTTNLIVLSRQDGHVVKELEIERSFVFHFVNCFEEDNQLVVDYCAYDNAERINRFYLDDLMKRGPGPLSIRATLRRTRLNLDTDDVNTTDSGIVFEMPTINYKYYNTFEYQFAYGITNHAGTEGIENTLVKIDMSNFSTTEWYEPNMYPQEGIFVANPDSLSEDDGVILTIVLDTGKQDSFLLVLNASDLTELARAYIGHIVPFGFHSAFY